MEVLAPNHQKEFVASQLWYNSLNRLLESLFVIRYVSFGLVHCWVVGPPPYAQGFTSLWGTSASLGIIVGLIGLLFLVCSRSYEPGISLAFNARMLPNLLVVGSSQLRLSLMSELKRTSAIHFTLHDRTRHCRCRLSYRNSKSRLGNMWGMSLPTWPDRSLSYHRIKFDSDTISLFPNFKTPKTPFRQTSPFQNLLHSISGRYTSNNNNTLHLNYNYNYDRKL